MTTVTSRQKSFSIKKWFLFTETLIAIKLTVIIQILALSNTKQLVWPILLTSTFLIIVYNLILFATYHHEYYLSLVLTVALYLINGPAIYISLAISDVYWFCSAFTSLTFVLGVLFTQDLYDIKEHVFTAEVSQHFINNMQDVEHKRQGLARRKISAIY